MRRTDAELRVAAVAVTGPAPRTNLILRPQCSDARNRPGHLPPARQQLDGRRLTRPTPRTRTRTRSDWAGAHRAANPSLAPGRCLVVGTSQGLRARVRPLPGERVLRIASTREDGRREGPVELPLDAPGELRRVARAGGFWAYVAGTALRLVTDFELDGGLDIDNWSTTLPLKKGLSSSAASFVLVARAFSVAFQLRLSARGEMAYAYAGERETPSLCGRMDQALAFGSVPVSVSFDGDRLDMERLSVGAAMHFLLVDLGGRGKDTVRILAALNDAYPVAADAQQEALQLTLGPANLKHVAAAEAAIVAGDLPALGATMTAAQHAFDAAAGPLCPSQLGPTGSPKLHALLGRTDLQPFIFGGKGVGSQGDGTAQLLCRDAAAQAALMKVLQADGLSCLPLAVRPGGAGVPRSVVAPPVV